MESSPIIGTSISHPFFKRLREHHGSGGRKSVRTRDHETGNCCKTVSSGWDGTACFHESTAAVINPVYTAARTEGGLTRTHPPANLLLTVDGFWEAENPFTSGMCLQVDWPCSSEWPHIQVQY